MNTTSEKLIQWSDKLRDLSAQGLKYANNVHDREHYRAVQDLAMEMLAVASGASFSEIEPLRHTIFSRPTPLVSAAAVVLNFSGEILLMRRSDNGDWNIPGGALEVGESPAEGVAREVREETGYACRPVALTGVYDSRIWGSLSGQHIYKFTFLCHLLEDVPQQRPSHDIEVLDVKWFPEDELPEGLWEGHRQRVSDAYRVWRGNPTAHFDPAG